MDRVHPIIDALNSLSRLEWARNNEFGTPESRPIPPIIVWRFKSSEARLVERVVELVNSFQGNVLWKMVLPKPTQRNNVIAPVRLLELSPSEQKGIWEIQRELSIVDPAFGEAANQDVVPLAARIRELKERMVK